MIQQLWEGATASPGDLCDPRMGDPQPGIDQWAKSGDELQSAGGHGLPSPDELTPHLHEDVGCVGLDLPNPETTVPEDLCVPRDRSVDGLVVSLANDGPERIKTSSSGSLSASFIMRLGKRSVLVQMPLEVLITGTPAGILD